MKQVHDFADDQTTLGELPTDGTIVEGRIDFEDDVDWFAITVDAGQIVRLSLATNNIYGLRAESNGISTFAANDREFIFDVEASGIYYFSVIDYGSTRSIANYTLNAVLIDDDFSADSATEGQLIVGNPAFGRVDFENDNDWFAINLTGDEVVRISSDANVTLTLVDENGAPLRFGEFTFLPNGNLSQILTVDQSYSSLFYVSVQGGPGETETDYTLFSEAFEDDFAGDASTDGEIIVGQTVSGDLQFSGDEDWFKINLNADEIVRIRTAETINLSLVNENGRLFENAGPSTVPEFRRDLILDGSLSGLYYVRVSNNVGNPEYTLLSEIVIDDHTSDASTQTQITVGDTITGAVDYYSDEDWFRIQLEEGDLSSFETTDDVQITLRTSDDRQFASSYEFTTDDGTVVQRLDLDGSYSGLFYIIVSSFSGEPTYSITSSVINDDFAGDQSTLGVLPRSGSLSGSIDFSFDEDWFAITLSEDDAIRLRTETNTDVGIDLLNANGNRVQSANTFFEQNGDIGKELVLNVDVSGVYYVRFENFRPVDYTVNIVDIEDEFSSDQMTTSVLTLNDTVTSSIDFVGDSDWFRIDLSEDDFVRFRLGGEDFEITIRDADGNFIADSFTNNSADAGFFQELLFTADTDGIYYIEVDFRFFGSVGEYTLASEAILDDFAGDTSTEGMISVGEVVTGSIDFRNDEDWFAINLVEGERVLFNATGDMDTNFRLRLYTEDGFELTSNRIDELEVTVDSSGLYFISVEWFGQDESSYELSATILEPIIGTSGDDVLFGTDRDDDINGLAGDDTIFVSLGDDIIDGGDGIDTFDVSQGESAFDGYFIDLMNGTAFGLGAFIGTDTLISIENIVGSLSHDEIIAGNSGSTILAGAGFDILTGGAGSDTIFGEAGDDSFIASAGNDYLDGGEGFDSITYRNSDAAVTLNFLTGEHTGGYAEGDILVDLEIVTGSGFDDVIYGNGSTASIQGGFGNDTIYAAELDDPALRNFLIGGEFAYGSNLGANLTNTGDDTLIGSSGRDVLIGLDGADVLNGGVGRDEIWYIFDRISGTGVDIDLASGTASGGNAAGDIIVNIEDILGSIYNDSLSGDENDNGLYGYFGDDVLYGRDGNDILLGGFGNDILSGGQGADIFFYRITSGVYRGDLNDTILDFEAADIISFGETYNYFGETVFLSFVGKDQFSGYAGEIRYGVNNGQTTIELDGDGDGIADEFIFISNGEFDLFESANAFGGFDLRAGIVGTNIRDSFRGTAATDIYFGEGGHDLIFGEGGDDVLFGGDGNDIIKGASGADMLFGDAGHDRLFGGSGADEIDGGTGDDEILGGSGNDVISGGDGHDEINGQANDDVIDGGTGHDEIFGEQGRDILRGGAGNDALRGGEDNDRLEGGSGHDFLGGSFGNDLLIGGTGNDRLYGGSGRDRLFGQQGEDLLVGGGGDDHLSGGGGNDVLNGQAGDDLLEGGSANDSLTGGSGADTFVFIQTAATTTITDFEDGVDMLDLSDFSDGEIQAALDSAVQQNGDSILTFSNGSVLILEDFDLADLSDEDIIGYTAPDDNLIV